MVGVAPILVVEDGQLLASMLQTLFEDEGYDVALAQSIDEAIGYLGQRQVALVLTDSFSAGGPQTLDRAAMLCECAGKSPVALMTGHRIDYDEALRRGFCDVIQKPFELDELLRRVRRCLNEPTPLAQT